MLNRHINIILLFFICSLFLICNSYCQDVPTGELSESETYSVIFSVEDKTNEAIIGAIIEIADQTQTTDDNGQATIKEIKTGKYSFTVNAEGYNKYEGQVAVFDADVFESIILSEKTIDTQENIVEEDIPDIYPEPQLQNGFKIYFKKPELEFKKGEIVSNVLIVVNQRDEIAKFTADVTSPQDWQLFIKKDRIWEIGIGDTVYIPVRIIPRSGFIGSSKFIFTAFLYDTSREFIGYSFFNAYTEKSIKWDLSVSSNKIYLLQGVEEVPFSLSLLNLGDESQDLQLQIQNLGINYQIIDSTDKIITKKPLNYTLGTNQDTTINLIFRENVFSRNNKMIDLENYNPYISFNQKKYSVYFRSLSSNPGEAGKYQSSKKIDFVRLANEEDSNPYGCQVLPLVMDLNAINILGYQPVMNLHLYGNASFEDNKNLFYSTQLSFYSSVLGFSSFENASFNVGYYTNKYDVSIGNVGSGLIGGAVPGGKGIRGNYYIDKNNKVGAFYTRGQKLFSTADYYSVGGSYGFQNNLFSIDTRFGQVSNVNAGRTSNIANLSAHTKIIKNHSFGIKGGISYNTFSQTSVNTTGFLLGANYSGQYIDKKLSTRLNGMYFSPDYGLYSSERISANHYSGYDLNKKLNLSMRNNFYRFRFSNTDTLNNYILNNSLYLNRKTTKLGSVSPFLFYDVSNMQNFEVHSRGTGFIISNYDFTNFSRYFINLKAGYNRAIDIEKYDRFFLQTSGQLQYRTWSFMARYNLGNFYLTSNYYLVNSAKNPQFIGLSLRNQFILPSTGWVFQNMINYNYSTVNGSNISFYPEIYYFSRGGWRFKIFAQWSLFKRGDVENIYYSVPDESQQELPTWNGNFNLGFGIRKEFGIPIPGTKDNYCSVEFVAFYDMNGNGIKDKDEIELENVVVRVDADEVISDKHGKCAINNIQVNTYTWVVFSLEDLDGWFPNISDSLLLFKNETVSVPFTKGVKVSGSVNISKEKWSAFTEVSLDLSRIRVTAANHKAYTTLTDQNGNFSFYLPQGDYTLTLDEYVLGERFQLLQNNIAIDVDESFDNIFVPFYIVEKKRKIQTKQF
ncbi:MAG: hypothetical protein ABIJ97_08925 [Bacteroidota bacterium]